MPAAVEAPASLWSMALQFQVCCAQPLSTSQTFNGWSNATSKQIVFEFIDVCIMQIALANVVQ